MKTAAALILALAATSAAAEPLPVRLKDGASWTLTVEHTRIDERAGRSGSVTAVSRLSLKKGAGGPDVLTVTPVSAKAGPGLPPEVAAAAQLQVPVVLEVEDDLSPTRIVNMPALRESFSKMLAAFDPKGASGADKVLSGLSDASITALATQDLARLAMVQNSDLPLGQAQSYDETLPNPLGGPAIKGVGTVKLESLDRTAGKAVISWRQSLDPQSAADSVKAMIEQMAGKAAPDKAAEARAALKDMRLQRDSECRYEIDTATGLVAHADCSTSVVAGAGDKSARRTDRWVYAQSVTDLR